MGKYIKLDIRRWVTCRNFYIGIVGVMLACWFSSYKMSGYDVWNMFTYISWQSTYTLIYAAASISYASCFLEDSENKFWNVCILRGGQKEYVRAKVFVSFISAVLTVTVGMLLFCCIWHIKNPWISGVEQDLELVKEIDCFGFLMKKETIFVYFICCSFFRGLLAGILALIATFMSLYIKNYLFILTVPIILYYFLVNYLTTGLGLPDMANICLIFDPEGGIFENSVTQIPYAFTLCIVMVILLERLMERKIHLEISGEEKRKVRNEN